MKGNICVVRTEEMGEQEFIAQSYEGAFSQGIEVCFQKYTQFFIKTRRRYPGQNDQIKFTNTCIDNIKCL